MSCGETLRKSQPPSLRRPKARSVSWMQTTLSSTDAPASAAAAKPREHPLPAVLGGFLAVGRAIVGVEAGRRVRIGADLRFLAGRLQRGAHAIDALVWNPRVGAAIKAEHRRLHLLHEVDRILRLEVVGRAFDPAIPRHAGVEPGAVRGVEPHDASAATKSGHGKLGAVAAIFPSPARAGIP